jgi:hypothetical protein
MNKEFELLPGVKGSPFFKSDKERDEWYQQWLEKLREANKKPVVKKLTHDDLFNYIKEQEDEIIILQRRLDKIEKRLSGIAEKQLDGTEQL